MFWINLKIALRNLRKNKLYAVINIGGLAVGLAIYLFGFLLVEYESTHDAFFTNSDRIYTVDSIFTPEILERRTDNGTHSALKPVLDNDLPELEASARTIWRQEVVLHGEVTLYQLVTFADPELLQIFDFTYIQGGADALSDPSGMVLSENTAIQYFGRTDVLGETITLNNEHEFVVSAVISVPQNSHFNSSWFSAHLEILAPFGRLGSIHNLPNEGNWNNQNHGDMTYLMLPPSLDQEWLQNQLDNTFDRLATELVVSTDILVGFSTNPLQRANLLIWDIYGLPLPTILTLLSLLVLITACINYTNLAIAQSMGRSREVGMRKSVGASQTQLVFQFLTESLVISAVALICALALLELLIPIFNNLTSKVLQFNYLATLPWLISTLLIVGLLSGLYPAWIITRTNAAEALRDTARKGRKSARVRGLMVGIQFSISVFMLAVVATMFAQNKSVEEASFDFPRSEVYTLSHIDAVSDQLDLLKRELEAIPGVQSVAYSSQVPFQGANSSLSVSTNPGDEASLIRMNQLRISPDSDFFATYDIPLLAGRYLDINQANDELIRGENAFINTIINDLAVQRLGFESPEDAINKRIFVPNVNIELVIVGVVRAQNLRGPFNAPRPWIFFWNQAPEWIDMASIRIGGENFQRVVEEIENTWKSVVPSRPISGQFLDEIFNEFYSVMTMLNGVIGGIALVAMLLALIGLFGLTAFYAAQSTKEIGVRKALGATSNQITKLLIWRFSKPLFWALTFALPAAFIASDIYLNIFSDRINSLLWILVLAGVASVLLGWLTVGGQAYRVARESPIKALRYE